MKKIFIEILGKDTRIYNNSVVSFMDSYLDLIKKQKIKIFLFSEKYKEEDLERKEELKKQNIFLLEYKSEEKLLEEILNLNKKYNIKYINTFTEDLIIFANNIKKELGQKITDNPELFRNKKIQRELLLKYDKNITVNFREEKIGNLHFKELEKEFGLPFILKPKDGIGSSGVAKIEKKEDLEKYKKNDILENKILIEEFIDGAMYSIGYFVDENGIIFSSKSIKVELANKLGINDFFIFNRIVSEDIENELNNYNIKSFIEKTVKACGIKNTFVHQEFKLTSKKQLKNIELNGRIGGYRLEMYQEGYNINLLEFSFLNESNINLKIQNNFSAFALYPERKGILKSYNYDLLEKIKKLDSFYTLRILPEKYEGKEIGLTKDGFGKVGGIKLKNKNYEQFKKDYDFIKNNYKKLLLLEKN